MFHDDVQTQFLNNDKRNSYEHPIDRVFTAYIPTQNQITHPQSNTRSNTYKSETKHIIQRQRAIRSFLNKPNEVESSVRKPITLDAQPRVLSVTSIAPPPQSVLAGLNERSTNNNNRQQTIKKEFEYQSPLLIRRHRPAIENLSFKQQVSDITNISGNQLSLSIPSNFTFRNRSSRVFLSDRPSYKRNQRIPSPRVKPIYYSKSINEIKQNQFQSKLIHHNNLLSPPIRTPTLSEQDATHTRTLADILRTKSNSTKLSRSRQSQSNQTEKSTTNLKTNDIQNLYISPRASNNPQHELELNKWNDSKSSNDGVSDDDESIIVDGNSSTSTYSSPTDVPQYHPKSSSFVVSDHYNTTSSPTLLLDNSRPTASRSSIKRNTSRRPVYHLALPSVTEHVDDEETDMKKILRKIATLQNDDFNENKFEQSVNDEDSLTFQLLNQQETQFEKNLSKLRKFQFNQN